MSTITDVRAVQPDLERAPPDWRRWFGQVAVRIDTKDGLVGYGVSGGGIAATTAVNELLRRTLVGMDTADTGAIGRAMRAISAPFGLSGLSMMAMSGVDLAVWDINAKAQRVSMAEFLGGAKVSRIPGYMTDPESIPEVLPPGIEGLKLAVGRDTGPDALARRVRLARKILGDGFGIMVDIGMKWDFETALSFARQVADCNLAWLEEPLPAQDVEGYRRLRQSCEIPIAGGEHCYNIAEFRRVMEAEALDIVQPDITWCGRMSTLVEVYQMAEEFGVQVCPHRGGDVWSLPAIAALGSYRLAEQARPWTPELNGPIEIDDLGYKVPENPGFGTEIDLFAPEARQ